ncbi:MAG: hypothetical protein HY692_02115 [Cyanobacteria bacterium NC_groundwater_1444_Ag_S-0.65um_54_12]|nr:hypothetical protein [Cyanobacteria bacterium NC_groundwater_1444_Ag_S-0.65um_54_12]
MSGSLAGVLGLTILLAPAQFASASDSAIIATAQRLAQATPLAEREVTLPESGAVALMVAYESALLAHRSAALGQEEIAGGHLRVARDYLALANRQLAVMAGTPGSTKGTSAQRDKEYAQKEQRARQEENVTKGGGGGPISWGILEDLANTAQDRTTAENTSKLVAAIGTELNRLGQMGGGGGPAERLRPLALRVTAIEHVTMAYTSAGRANAAAALQDWSEAHDKFSEARHHLEEARNAPGNATLRPKIDRMSRALQDAGRPIRSRSRDATIAMARAVQEMTQTINSIGQELSSQQKD